MKTQRKQTAFLSVTESAVARPAPVATLALCLVTACFATGCAPGWGAGYGLIADGTQELTDSSWAITDHVLESSREPLADELGPVEKAYITTDGQLLVCLRGRLSGQSAAQLYHIEIALDECVEHASRQASQAPQGFGKPFVLSRNVIVAGWPNERELAGHLALEITVASRVLKRDQFDWPDRGEVPALGGAVYNIECGPQFAFTYATRQGENSRCQWAACRLTQTRSDASAEAKMLTPVTATADVGVFVAKSACLATFGLLYGGSHAVVSAAPYLVPIR